MSMEFEPAYHLHCGIVLADGRSITLQSLEQRRTYLGLLEGYPATKQNDRLIEQTMERIRRRDGQGARPHLVPPVRRAFMGEPVRPLTAHELRRPPE